MAAIREKRNKCLRIKITNVEHADWKRRAKSEGVTLADFIRTRIDAKQVNLPKKQRLTKAPDPALIRQLSGFGNNLNQIAAWANTYKRSTEAVHIIHALIALEEQMKRIADKS